MGLKRYGDRRIVRFHTPGHRGGRWLDPLFGDALGRSAATLDVSDVLEGESGPGDWSAAIRQAEARAARLVGASATRFLVNGTSGGIHAALLAVGMGKRAVYGRASHLSVYAGALLAGMESHLIEPDYDPAWDIPGPPSRTAVQKAIREHRPDIAIETYPTYYGLAPDLGRWTAPDESLRAPLLITDEAHGSHFLVCPGSPPPALTCGAAITVQSFHKTLGALTQASALHVSQSGSEWVAAVDRSLFLVQTTSPSPLLLASLEAAVSQVERLVGRACGGAEPAAEDGGDGDVEPGWEWAVHLAQRLRAAIDQETGCRCLSEGYALERWGAKLDPARLVVNVAEAGWSGIDASRWLRSNRRIQVEMANQTAIVVLVSPGNTDDEAELLIDGLKALSSASAPRPPAVVAPPPPARTVADPREALARPAAWIEFGQAVGRIASELVCPYPPGVPVLAPGEEITPEIVEYLRHVRSVGWEVRGAAMWEEGRIGVVR